MTLRSRNERFLKIPPPALRAQIPPKQRVGPLRIISATLHNPRQIVSMLCLQHQHTAFSDYATRSGSCRRSFMRATLPPPRSARSHPRSAESVPPRVALSGWFGTVYVIGEDLQRALGYQGNTPPALKASITFGYIFYSKTSYSFYILLNSKIYVK